MSSIESIPNNLESHDTLMKFWGGGALCLFAFAIIGGSARLFPAPGVYTCLAGAAIFTFVARIENYAAEDIKKEAEKLKQLQENAKDEASILHNFQALCDMLKTTCADPAQVADHIRAFYQSHKTILSKESISQTLKKIHSDYCRQHGHSQQANTIGELAKEFNSK